MAIEQLFLDDYEVGQMRRSVGRTVDASDIRTWAGIVSDYTELHVNADMMASSPFGQPIAHGYVALNLAVGLFMPAHASWYWPESATRHEGWREIRFNKPVRSGDTLTGERVIAEIVDDAPDSGVVLHKVTVYNQEGEPVMTGDERIRILKRSPKRTS